MSRCACGCGAEVTEGRKYRQGHFAKAGAKPKPEPQLCACGCGEYATVRYGEAKSFRKGHHRRRSGPKVVPAPCLCGCGELTAIYRGKPRRYVLGHHARGEHNSRFGAKLTDETKAKIANRNRQAALEGRNPKTTAGWKHSDESRHKMSESHAKNLRTGEKNPFFGKKHIAESKAKWAAKRALGPVLPTKPERAVHEELRRLGVGFVTEHVIGHYCVDIFVPSLNLIIFVDGCYWHACPVHHPTRSRPGSDNARIPYLSKCGYHVAIVWEHEIEEDPCQAVTSIIAALPPGPTNSS